MSEIVKGVLALEVIGEVHTKHLQVKAMCNILFSTKNIKTAVVRKILLEDLLYPILQYYIFNIHSDRLDQLRAAQGKLKLYWFDSLTSTKQLYDYWRHIDFSNYPALVDVWVDRLYLFSRRFEDDIWDEELFLQFDHDLNAKK
ncbi:MAG: hypothetical protein ACKKL5_00255 [Candidatus Komeilibacteria bacterium]